MFKKVVVSLKEICLKDRKLQVHHHIASNAGVIRVTSLQQLFPEMQVELLVSLEYCMSSCQLVWY